MRVYKDIFNGDELYTDSLPIKEIVINGYPLLSEVETKQISRSKVGNIDIGANPSAEEGGDEGADGDNDTVTVNNLVDACKLVV
jgi:Translationally controlled tumour protein